MSAPRRGTCADPGPWGSHCTDHPGHRYSHYDGGDDRSWQDDWREDTPPEGGGTYIDEHKAAPDQPERLPSWDTVVQFQEYLKRAPISNTITPWFDGDIHLLAPLIADRSKFTIADGQLQPGQ